MPTRQLCSASISIVSSTRGEMDVPLGQAGAHHRAAKFAQVPAQIDGAPGRGRLQRAMNIRMVEQPPGRTGEGGPGIRVRATRRGERDRCDGGGVFVGDPVGDLFDQEPGFDHCSASRRVTVVQHMMHPSRSFA
jgi:hypothetical protein